MKRIFILLLAVQVAACAHGTASVSTSTAAGVSVTAGSTAVGAQVTAAGSGAGAIALFALAAAMLMSSGTESANGAAIDGSSRRPPELDASRRVHEQDCTKPISDFSANLRCR